MVAVNDIINDRHPFSKILATPCLEMAYAQLEHPQSLCTFKITVVQTESYLLSNN